MEACDQKGELPPNNDKEKIQRAAAVDHERDQEKGEEEEKDKKSDRWRQVDKELLQEEMNGKKRRLTWEKLLEEGGYGRSF